MTETYDLKALQGSSLPSTSFHSTDLGNARRLINRHGQDLRYTNAHGWLTWDGRRWVIDETASVMRDAKESVLSIYGDAGQLTDDDENRKRLLAWAKTSESTSKLKAAVENAQSEPEIAIHPSVLDADPWKLNVQNGTLNLKADDFGPHEREHYLTKVAGVQFDPCAKCPTWDNFLLSVMDDDPEMVGFLRRAVGYSLTGDTREQKLFFCHGSGANGKSVFLNVIRKLLGDYAGVSAPGLFLEKRNQQHPTEIADLQGRRMIVSSETGEGKRLAEDLVKMATGGEPMKGRRMRQDFIEFQPAFKLWLSSNHKPIIVGSDYAIWRRIPLIPFEVTFTDAPDDPKFQKDPQMEEKLLAELPGILNWALQGCQEWQQKGLMMPEKVQAATDAYRAEMDVLGQFLDERCVINRKEEELFADLYFAYEVWCEDSGERPLTKKSLGIKLTERGFTDYRGTGGAKMRRGLRLLKPFEQQIVTEVIEVIDFSNYQPTSEENSGYSTQSITPVTPITPTSDSEDTLLIEEGKEAHQDAAAGGETDTPLPSEDEELCDCEIERRHLEILNAEWEAKQAAAQVPAEKPDYWKTFHLYELESLWRRFGTSPFCWSQAAKALNLSDGDDFRPLFTLWLSRQMIRKGTRDGRLSIAISEEAISYYGIDYDAGI